MVHAILRTQEVEAERKKWGRERGRRREEERGGEREKVEKKSER